MKVLFYSPIHLYSGGGCERWHCDITNSLKKQFGVDVSIITANLGPSNWSPEYLHKQLKGIPYSKISFPVVFGALLPTPSAFIHLLREFRKADAIHVIQGFIGQDLLLLLLKVITRKKIFLGWHAPIFHSQRLHNWYIQWVTRCLLNFFDGHMTLNQKDKDFLEEKWHIKNVHFIPSGIRTERFMELSRKPHRELNFLTVGHYRTQKGIDLALEAISLFNKKYKKNAAVFRFVGSGEYKDMLTIKCKKHHNIHDLGFVEYEKMPALYQKSDVYLLPSREEPFGLVLIEAWAAGIPVLATKTEGPLDMLSPGRNGWFITSITSNDIYQGILRIYDLWISAGKNLINMAPYCRQTAQRYSIDITAKRMYQYLFLD